MEERAKRGLIKMLIKKKLEKIKQEKNNIMSEKKKLKDVSEEYDFKEKLEASYHLNMPIFKIFSDYFNILNQNPELQKKHKIKVKGFLINNEFRETINLYDGLGIRNILIEYSDLLINLVFDVYKQHGEITYYFRMVSDKQTDMYSEDVYKMLFSNAIKVSDLKGKHLVLRRNAMEWDKKELEPKEFNDIYLPDSIIKDLELYSETFNQIEVLMRYLMAGSPGTGKTESTLVIANELIKRGVTVIKTPICKYLKEKVELGILLAPTIFIFDDIDLSLGSRNRGFFSENLQIFLDVLDGTEKLPENVGIIATTNSTSLLDLAAQRPGRFDKFLCFDELTKDNIKNIILKSLKYNDPKASAERKKLFASKEVVDMFHSKRVTGAYIFNGVKMLNRRINILKLKDLTPAFIAEEFSKEISVQDKNKNKNFLDDKLSNSSSSSIGFANNDVDGDVEYEEDNSVKVTEEIHYDRGEGSERRHIGRSE